MKPAILLFLLSIFVNIEFFSQERATVFFQTIRNLEKESGGELGLAITDLQNDRQFRCQGANPSP